MLSLIFIPLQQRSSEYLSFRTKSVAHDVQGSIKPSPSATQFAPESSTRRLMFAGDNREAMFTIPNLMTQWIGQEQMKALVTAHWNEFMLEEVILAQGDQCLGREAEDVAQMQLALHKLERARLEVECYSDAIARATRTWRIPDRPLPTEIHPNCNEDLPPDGLSEDSDEGI